MKKIICRCKNHELIKGNDNFYYILFPDGGTMVNTSGTKNEVMAELERWKREIDYNNSYMLKIENAFIECLRGDKN